MFVKGQSGNPAGKKKGTQHSFSWAMFNEALRKVEKEKKKSLYVHAIERAYESDRVLAVILNKILPDLPKESISEDYQDNEIEFVGVPQNGEGHDRFKEYLN